MDIKRPTVTLYRDRDMPGSYGWSPFVAKLETRLRFSHLPYTAQLGSLFESPKGKLPYIKVSEAAGGPPSILSDSSFITRALIEEAVIDDLNADLSPAQKAMDLAIRSLLEDKIYFMTVSLLSMTERRIGSSKSNHMTHSPSSDARTLAREFLRYARPRPSPHDPVPHPASRGLHCALKNHPHHVRARHR
jgi:hypothetical protein